MVGKTTWLVENINPLPEALGFILSNHIVAYGLLYILFQDIQLPF